MIGAFHLIGGTTNLGRGQLEECIRQEIAIPRIQYNIFAALQLLRPCAKIIRTDLPSRKFVKGMADILSESSG
ncbi:hypothetical protein AB4Y88_12995 [Paenarthrobacter sp. RAF9]